MSLYASIQDLELLGLPPAALATVAASRMPVLANESSKADSKLRAKYTLPVLASVGEISWNRATGSTGTGQVAAAITSGSSVTRALGIRLEVLTTGASGVATGRLSVDSGITWGASFLIVNGNRVLSCGVTLTFSDPDGLGWFDGDLCYVCVNFGALTGAVVSLAAWRLLGRRGVDPDSAGYDWVKTDAKAAEAWLEGIPKNVTDPGLTDSTPSVDEGGFFFDPAEGEEGDRVWTQAMGRSARTTASSCCEEW